MRETKIVQAYPSDSAIKNAIDEWESFGWEMTDNQRISSSEELWFPGGTTTRTTTCNKITFSREKSSPWYAEVKPLETQYEAVQSEISSIRSQKPVKKGYGQSCMDYVTILLPIPLISHIVYMIIKNARHKKKLKQYEAASKDKIAELDAQARDIRRAAKKIVDAAQ